MALLRAIDKVWAALLWLMMAAASVYIGFIMLAILYMTICRTFGWSYHQIVNTWIEYGFVYILFLGSPWLVRTRGHVYIEMLTAAVPPSTRNIVSRVITAISAAICLVWFWYTLGSFLEHAEDPMAYDESRAEMGYRSWVWSIALPTGFLFMAIEFLRFVFGREIMHSGTAGVANERAELEEAKRGLTAGSR